MTIESYQKSSGAVFQRSLVGSLERVSLTVPQLLTEACDTHQKERAKVYFEIYNALVVQVRGRGFIHGEKLLEFGVGPAFIASRFQESGLDVSGIDIEDKRDSPFTNLAIAQNSLPFAESSFDYLSATSVMHHIPTSDHQSYFREFARVLDDHGILLIQEDRRGRDFIEHTAIRIVDRFVSGIESNSHRTSGRWKEFFEENGYKIGADYKLTHKKGPFHLSKLFFALTKADFKRCKRSDL